MRRCIPLLVLPALLLALVTLWYQHTPAAPAAKSAPAQAGAAAPPPAPPEGQEPIIKGRKSSDPPAFDPDSFEQTVRWAFVVVETTVEMLEGKSEAEQKAAINHQLRKEARGCQVRWEATVRSTRSLSPSADTVIMEPIAWVGRRGWTAQIEPFSLPRPPFQHGGRMNFTAVIKDVSVKPHMATISYLGADVERVVGYMVSFELDEARIDWPSLKARIDRPNRKRK